MAEKTGILWCDHTFNCWIGCSKVAEGCTACYAEELMANRYHRVQWGDKGTRVRTKTWGDPVKWNRQAGEDGVRRKVFCASLADVFEDRPELVPWRQDLFRLIDQCQSLDWLLLTKRPQNIITMWPDDKCRDNVWLGTSIAVQKNLVDYAQPLLKCWSLCKYLFLSMEPQIERITLLPILYQIKWVIQGGESKQGTHQPRPFDMAWVRHTIQECREAHVPCFAKQMGSNVLDGGKKVALKDKHGGDMDEWPADLRVRESPETYFRTTA